MTVPGKFCAQWISRILAQCQQPGVERVLITSQVSTKLHEQHKDRKQAAVLIPLCNRNGKASLLYTLRSDTVGTHKGQVSFPGGHLDKGETVIDAAIRECQEELGPGIGPIQILGVCQTIPAITGTLVTPVIGFVQQDLEDLQALTPNPDEVSQVFTRSIQDLTSPEFISYEMLSRQGKPFEFPVYGAKEPPRIWGLTAIITHGVLNNVLVPTQSS